MSDGRYRIGVVPYLNVAPLVYGLEARPEVQLVHAVPSELAVFLQAGEIDVGIVPIVEYLRGVGDCLLPGMSISARGPVRSVLVFLVRPAGEVETIATDTGSRSSAALAQVIFRKQYAVNPIQVPCPPDLDQMLNRADAALLIGDNALDRAGAPFVKIDLGEAWHQLTGLPFTFAAWVAREGAPVDALVPLLQEAKAAGVANLASIAEETARRGRFSASLVTSYLTENLDHDLTEDHLNGIRRFATLAAELGIIRSPREPHVAG